MIKILYNKYIYNRKNLYFSPTENIIEKKPKNKRIKWCMLRIINIPISNIKVYIIHKKRKTKVYYNVYVSVYDTNIGVECVIKII